MQGNWDDLKIILYLVRLGSLAAAANALGVNYTTVARRITAAEARLGTRLFDRLPGGYVPTDAALEAARFAARMEEQENAFRRQLAGSQRHLSGAFAITAPPLLIAPHLASVIERFLTKHPLIELTVRATNDLLNLNNREAELAIRISNKPGDNLVGRRLARQQNASFAAPDVADRIRRDPDRRIDWIGLPEWRTPPKASLVRYPNARIRIRFNDMASIVEAAQAGLGVARMPLFLGRGSGGLEQVPVLAAQKYADIWVVSHRDLKSSAKVQAFKDVLIPYFKAHAEDFVETAASA
jgi:DNA-binding transcriptional LysR family regulator